MTSSVLTHPFIVIKYFTTFQMFPSINMDLSICSASPLYLYLWTFCFNRLPFIATQTFIFSFAFSFPKRWIFLCILPSIDSKYGQFVYIQYKSYLFKPKIHALITWYMTLISIMGLYTGCPFPQLNSYLLFSFFQPCCLSNILTYFTSFLSFYCMI